MIEFFSITSLIKTNISNSVLSEIPKSITNISNEVLPEIPKSINVIGTDIELLRIVSTLIILLVGFIFAKLFKRLVTRRSKKQLPHNINISFSKTIYYIIIAITVFSAIGYSGINLSGLVVAGGAIGIIIGFATQSLFSNLISGLFLYIDKPFKIGDPVLITGKLPEIAGNVTKITSLSCRFKLFNGTEVRLPNSEVFTSEIHNFYNTVVRRIEVEVGVSYKHDATQVIKIINEIISKNEFILVVPSPKIYVNEFGDSSVNINIWFWVPTKLWFDIKMEILEEIKKTFDLNNIEIPFPQRSIHINK